MRGSRMKESLVTINDLIVPESLLKAMNIGLWNSAMPLKGINDLGVEYPEDIRLFGIEQMQVVTQDLRALEASEAAELYRVTISDNCGPETGWLNVRRAIVIGGGYSEEMICLDYQDGDKSPVVVSQNCEARNWKKNYDSVDEFIDNLGF